MFLRSAVPLLVFIQLAVSGLAYPQLPPNIAGAVAKTTTTTTTTATTTSTGVPTPGLPAAPPSGILPRQYRNQDYNYASGSTGPAPVATATPAAGASSRRRQLPQMPKAPSAPGPPGAPVPPSAPSTPNVVNVASITNSTPIAAHGSKREPLPGSFVFGSLRFARADAPEAPGAPTPPAPASPSQVGSVTKMVPRQALTPTEGFKQEPGVVSRSQLVDPHSQARPMEEVPENRARTVGRQVSSAPTDKVTEASTGVPLKAKGASGH